MRVLLVMTARQVGGAELYVKQLVDARRERCQFTIAISDHPNLASLRADLARHNALVALPFDQTSSLPGVSRRLVGIAAVHDLVQLISNHPASRLGILMGFLLPRSGKPLICVEQRATPVTDVRVPPVLAPVLPALFKHSRRKAARVVAVSQENRQTLVSNYGLPPAMIEVIHNSVDLSRFQRPRGPAEDLRTGLGLSPEQPVVLVLARLLPNKGHRYLVEAAPAILTRFPQVHFVFAGEMDARTPLEQQIAALDLGAHFSFLGFRSDVENLLHNSDLFVLPSLAEGFSLSIIEALASGVPVVASQVGGAAEVIEHGRNGFLVPPADPPALAAAINALLGMDPATRQALIRTGYETAQRFSIDAMADRTFSLYRQVTATHAHLS